MNDFHKVVGTGKGLHLPVVHQAGTFLWFSSMRCGGKSTPNGWDTLLHHL